MDTNRRRFLSVALVGAVLWCAPGVIAAESGADGDVTRLTLAVPGMT